MDEVIIQPPAGEDHVVEAAVKQYIKMEFTLGLYRQEAAILQDIVTAMTHDQYEEYVKKTGGF